MCRSLRGITHSPPGSMLIFSVSLHPPGLSYDISMINITETGDPARLSGTAALGSRLSIIPSLRRGTQQSMAAEIPPQYHTVSRQDIRQHWMPPVVTGILTPHLQCGPIRVAFEIAKHGHSHSPPRGFPPGSGPKIKPSSHYMRDLLRPARDLAHILCMV